MASEDSDRQRRLAEALRANLRRRKGQARERDTDTVAEADEPMDAGGAGPRETAARPDEDQKR